MYWPVINPLGRHENARRLRDGANPPDWPPQTMKLGMDYWGSEQTMAEGNPLMALERGEKVVMPPTLWLQPKGDLVHDYRDPNSGFDGTEAQRFVALYRKAGGDIELEYYDAPLHFTQEHPTDPPARAAFARANAFIHKHIPVR
jgi:hypothetical protein